MAAIDVSPACGPLSQDSFFLQEVKMEEARLMVHLLSDSSLTFGDLVTFEDVAMNLSQEKWTLLNQR